MFFVFVLAVIVFSCNSTKKMAVKSTNDEEVVVISNDSLEYEIIIIDQGYHNFLLGVAKPKWYYSEEYYKINNTFYVSEWNLRVLQPYNYSTNIYEMQIDYDPNVDYGLEVNYMLYNYFKFVEYKYKVRFY